MDVFFVISGFLITSLLLTEMEAGAFSIPRFYERRARRLFPALFAMLAATTVAAIFIMTPFDLESFAKSAVATTLFAANIWFFRQQGYFTEAAELSPLLHTWSLGVEEQYYIVFPPLLYALLRLSKGRTTVAVTLAAAFGSFLAAVYVMPKSPEAAFFLPQFRIWELLLGSLLAMGFWRNWGFLREMPQGVAQLLGGAGLVAIIVPMFLYSPTTSFPGISAVPPSFGAAALIASGVSGKTLSARILSLGPMVLVGKLSYSLYLWHWPVIAFAFYMFGPLSPGTGALCVVSSLVLSALSLRFVEGPVRDRKRFGNRSIFIGSAIGLVCFLFVGVTLWKLDGIPGRMDPAVLAMADSGNFLHDRRDCHLVTPERAKAGDICLRGRAGVTPRFVLVGDSHADAISPAVFGAADDLGLAGYHFTDAGFLPLPNVLQLGRLDDGMADAFLDFIDTRPEIDTIIVTTYWLEKLQGETYRHKGKVLVDDEYDGSLTHYNPIAIRHGIEQLATRLADRRIILLDDVPSGDELHIRSRLRLLRFNDNTRIGLDAHIAQQQRSTYEPLFERLAAVFPNVEYRPIFQDLCGTNFCPLFNGDMLIFRDGDHLSWKGALRLKQSVRDLLLEIYPSPPKI